MACPYPHAERCTFPPSWCLEKESVTPPLSSHRLSPLPVFTLRSGWSVLRARVLAVLKKRVPLHPTLHPTVACSILVTWIFMGGRYYSHQSRGTLMGIDFLSIFHELYRHPNPCQIFFSLVNLLSDTCLVVIDSRETSAPGATALSVDTRDLGIKSSSFSPNPGCAICVPSEVY